MNNRLEKNKFEIKRTSIGFEKIIKNIDNKKTNHRYILSLLLSVIYDTKQNLKKNYKKKRRHVKYSQR